MKNILLYIVFGFCFLTLMEHVRAQASDPCRQLIQRSYSRITIAGSKSSAASTFIHYTTNISRWNNQEIPDSKTEIRLVASNNQLHFETKEASLYSDQKDVFLVVNHTGDIVHNKAVLTPKEENFFIAQNSLIKDSLILTAKISYCQDVTLKDGTIARKIEIIPAAKSRQEYRIEKVVFVIDKNSEMIRQLHINYSKASEIRQISNYYHAIDTNYKKKLSTPVYYLFFDKQNRLLPKYKDFNYIENSL